MPDPRPTGAFLSNCPQNGGRGLTVLLTLSLSTTACLFQSKPPRLFVPPPVEAKPVVVKPPPVLEASMDLKIEPPVEPPDVDWPLPQFPAPPKPAIPQRPRVYQTPKPEGPPLPQPATPKITQVFSSEQLREYTRQFDESLDRARKALEILGKKNVPAADQTEVERIRTFLAQAEQARTQDLVTAVRLARDADLLAKALLDRLP